MKDRNVKQILLDGGYLWEGAGVMERLKEGEYG
jgi:hypothetical protein